MDLSRTSRRSRHSGIWALEENCREFFSVIRRRAIEICLDWINESFTARHRQRRRQQWPRWWVQCHTTLRWQRPTPPSLQGSLQHAITIYYSMKLILQLWRENRSISHLSENLQEIVQHFYATLAELISVLLCVYILHAWGLQELWKCCRIFLQVLW